MKVIKVIIVYFFLSQLDKLFLISNKTEINTKALNKSYFRLLFNFLIRLDFEEFPKSDQCVPGEMDYEKAFFA